MEDYHRGTDGIRRINRREGIRQRWQANKDLEIKCSNKRKRSFEKYDLKTGNVKRWVIKE